MVEINELLDFLDDWALLDNLHKMEDSYEEFRIKLIRLLEE